MRYQKPRSVNVVSITLLVLVAVGVYVAVNLWPVYSTSARVRSAIHDHIPALYKANLRSDDVAIPRVEKVKADLMTALRGIGLNEKTTTIIIQRNKEEISIEVRYKCSAHFPFPDRNFEFNLSPKVATDAKRIDW